MKDFQYEQFKKGNDNITMQAVSFFCQNFPR